MLWIAQEGRRRHARPHALAPHTTPFSWPVRGDGRQPGDSRSGSLMRLGGIPTLTSKNASWAPFQLYHLDM